MILLILGIVATIKAAFPPQKKKKLLFLGFVEIEAISLALLRSTANTHIEAQEVRTQPFLEHPLKVVKRYIALELLLTPDGNSLKPD